MSKIKTQIGKLYCLSGIEALSLGGASWVALLALRGYSLTEIGVIEAIFHVVSLCGEIPSGAVADVLGRKKTMVASKLMAVLSAGIMIAVDSYFGIILAIAIGALSYNLASGTREALAYDSLKQCGREKEYKKFSSNEMMIYRIGSGVSTLFAGLALAIGYKKAYTVDVILGIAALLVACMLSDVTILKKSRERSVIGELINCIKESMLFLKRNPKAVALIGINSLVGAIATLLLFFLQAKLPGLGLGNTLLGPALFLMTLGAALGAKLVQYFSKSRYLKIMTISCSGIAIGLAMLFTHNPYLVVVGGFVAAFSDDFMQVRTDVILNGMIPSEQRATLVSVCSFAFSTVMIVLSPVMGYLLELI